MQQVNIEKSANKPIKQTLGISDVLKYQSDIATIERSVVRHQIQQDIEKMERKLIRCQIACHSSFSRPADHENLINTKSELTALQSQLAKR